MKKIVYLIVVLSVFISCSSSKRDEKQLKKKNAKAEYIVRRHDTRFFPIFTPKKQTRDLYPWEDGKIDNISKITKDFFRCKGSSLNPTIFDDKSIEKPLAYEDCQGASKHSLPIINKKENVYPILIEILNFLQSKTRKRVVITSGHRCPKHNSYCNSSKENRTSKHLIGAEVDFYIQGLEEKPEEVVDLILSFFKENKRYLGKKEFTDFLRYENETNVCVKPWYNKEVFVKLFQKEEGRDFDNRHPYPYISIQVRYDRDTKERVVYSWEKANTGYLRW